MESYNRTGYLGIGIGPTNTRMANADYHVLYYSNGNLPFKGMLHEWEDHLSLCLATADLLQLQDMFTSEDNRPSVDAKQNIFDGERTFQP